MKPSDYQIILDHNPTRADNDTVLEGLIASNEKAMNEPRDREFSVFLKDSSGKVFGGLKAYFDTRAIYTEFLWVDESLQRQGYGTQLLLAAETEAIKQGCHSSFVDTFEFQAKPFYLKHGYEVIGELPQYWEQYSKFFLKKELQKPKNLRAPASDCRIFEATPAQVKIINDKIDQFNAAQLAFIGELEAEKNYVITDELNNVIASILGCLYLQECLYIHILFVEEGYRKQGLGRILLEFMEQEARSLGVKLIHLDTFDFQAKDFYIKYGYEVFGVLDDCPQGHKRYYMKKALK